MKNTSTYTLILVSFLFWTTNIFSQVSISEIDAPPDESAVLDLISQDKGFLAPRMTLTERNNIVDPANSLLIFQTDNTPGFYYNTGTAASPVWKLLDSESSATKIPISSLPYSITESGSYYLTTTIDAGTDTGISIASNNVSIDLNGYTLLGDGTTSNSAIYTTASFSNINVFNGIIDNWGSHGINLQNSSEINISNIIVTQSSSSGMLLGSNAKVAYCTANDNGADGIASSTNAIISNCITSENNADGIDVGNQSVIALCNSFQNGDNGLETSSNCTVSNSISNYNNGDGINSGLGADISNSKFSNNQGTGISMEVASTANNNIVKSNDSYGLSTTSDSYLINNISDNNGDSGYFVSGSDNRIDSNQATDNIGNGYEISGSGNLTIRNSASGNTALAFNVSASNTTAIVLTTATINSNDNPFANVSF